MLLASGGVYTKGSPIRNRNIAGQYLRLILNVVGITDVTLVPAGGAKTVDLREETRASLLTKLEAALQRAAGA